MRSCYRCVRRCWNTQDSNTLRGVQNSRKRFPGKASCEPGLKFIPSGVFICRTRPRLLAKVPRKGPSGVLSGSMEECVMCVANNQKLGLRFRQETNGVFGVWTWYHFVRFFNRNLQNANQKLRHILWPPTCFIPWFHQHLLLPLLRCLPNPVPIRVLRTCGVDSHNCEHGNIGQHAFFFLVEARLSRWVFIVPLPERKR